MTSKIVKLYDIISKVAEVACFGCMTPASLEPVAL